MMRWAILLALLLPATGAAEGPTTVLTLGDLPDLLEITAGDILRLQISESGGKADVFIQLGDAARDELAILTAASIGQPLAISACGAVLSAPVVQDQILSGTIVISDTTVIRAEALRALWHGRTSCAQTDPEVFANGN